MRRKLALMMAFLVLVSLASPLQLGAAEQWIPQVSGVTTALWDVDFVNANIGCAVGSSGTILHTTDGGSTWSPRTSGTSQTLYDVDFVDANNGWAVGGGGIIRRTADGGTTWGIQGSGTTARLEAVDFVGLTNGWIVGSSGTILHTTDGSTWSPLTSGTTVWLYGVDFVDSTNGWAVGAGGIIRHTTDGGATWTSQTSGTTYNLYDVAFVSSTIGVAAGAGGVIVRTTDGGTTWAFATSGVGAYLYDVDFVDSTNGWAVGAGGTILWTNDGGATWYPQTSGTTQYLYGVGFTDLTRGWAVGNNGTILKYTSTSGVSRGSGVTVTAQAPIVGAELTFSITPEIHPEGGSVTGSSIDFGMLIQSTPKTGSQRLSVSTNAANGYNVTTEEDHPLQSGANTIPDVIGDDSTITEIVAGPWSLATTYGFGYTLANVSGTDATFATDYKQFADKSFSEVEQAVMSKTGPVTNSQVDVTYKLNIGPGQPAGTYWNTITYIATGNF